MLLSYAVPQLNLAATIGVLFGENGALFKCATAQECATLARLLNVGNAERHEITKTVRRMLKLPEGRRAPEGQGAAFTDNMLMAIDSGATVTLAIKPGGRLELQIKTEQSVSFPGLEEALERAGCNAEAAQTV